MSAPIDYAHARPLPPPGPLPAWARVAAAFALVSAAMSIAGFGTLLAYPSSASSISAGRSAGVSIVHALAAAASVVGAGCALLGGLPAAAAARRRGRPRLFIVLLAALGCAVAPGLLVAASLGR